MDEGLHMRRILRRGTYKASRYNSGHIPLRESLSLSGYRINGISSELAMGF